jgi:hypothetical protein
VNHLSPRPQSPESPPRTVGIIRNLSRRERVQPSGACVLPEGLKGDLDGVVE